MTVIRIIWYLLGTLWYAVKADFYYFKYMYHSMRIANIKIRIRMDERR